MLFDLTLNSWSQIQVGPQCRPAILLHLSNPFSKTTISYLLLSLQTSKTASPILTLWWVLLLISMGKKKIEAIRRECPQLPPITTTTDLSTSLNPYPLPPSCCYGQTVPALGKANSPTSELSIVKSTSQLSPYSTHQRHPINSFLKHFSSFGFWDPTLSCSPTLLAPSFPVSLVSFSSSPWDQNVAVLQGSVLSPLLHLCSFL